MAPAKCIEEEVELGRHHRPAGEGPFPGLVLVHDVWGLSPHSRELASDLAAEGFGVLEIDLYRDRDGPPTADPGAFIRALPDPAILGELDAGADWLIKHPTGRGQKVGIVGVCMGGTFTLLAASTSDRFSAAAPFYGILSYDTGMLANPDGRDHERKPKSPIEIGAELKMPLRASFGLEDDFVPNEDVDALASAVEQSGQAFAIDRYAGAGHAFLNRTRAEAYRREAAELAWRRVIPFLRSALS